MPDRAVIDLIFAEEGKHGWTVRSPSIPGLVGGRETLEQLVEDLPDLLVFAGFDPAALVPRTHFERSLAVPDEDVVVRVAWDDHQLERVGTANRLKAAFDVPEQREGLLSVPRTVTGEVLYICVVPSDTVEWITDQLGPSGDAAAVATSIAEGLIWTTHFLYGPGLARKDDAPSLGDLGYTEKTTMAELLRDSQKGSSRKPLVLQI